MVEDPLIVLEKPLKVCVPVLAVYVPLLVKFPAIITVAAPFSVSVPEMVTSFPNVNCAATDSDNVAPEFIVTAPVKVFIPVELVKVKIPLAPSPIVVVPVTVNAKAPSTLKWNHCELLKFLQLFLYYLVSMFLHLLLKYLNYYN